MRACVCMCVCVVIGIPPGPEEELLDEEVPHDPLHLAEPRGEGGGLVGEGLDEARLVLLPEQTQDEGLLA